MNQRIIQISEAFSMQTECHYIGETYRYTETFKLTDPDREEQKVVLSSINHFKEIKEKIDGEQITYIAAFNINGDKLFQFIKKSLNIKFGL